jgi:rod shape-determining protein MreC
MTGLLATRTGRRRGIAFTGLLVVSMLLMAFSSNAALLELQRGLGFAFRPMQSALAGAAAGVADIVATIAEIDRLRSDNAALRQERDRLAVENARLLEVGRENQLLTGLLQLQSGFEHETVAAAVIARESSEFRRTVTLDRGAGHGISVGDVVIGQGGALAGRVVEVGATFAHVMLITDGDSTVIGQLHTSAATGEVTGQLDGTLIMSQIDSTQRVQLGEEVLTAGIELGGGIRSPFPRGLLIGQIVDVVRDANDVVQTAFLQPAINLDRLEYLLVITDYEGGISNPIELPTDCEPEDPESGALPDGEEPCLTPDPSALPSVDPSGAPSPRSSARP